jgi:diaminohydroxyphosphoribosylaminopyrimidine deaminase/5-amino-6-(5-phosphoribosylamino)uracil reductase
MQSALALARRGEGKTRPNPPVGCVLVKGDRLVGKGYHRRAGGPHAEIHALKDAGSAAKGSVAYVTLEPCSTRGRTGPCTDALIQAGITRLVAACRDPYPGHNGRGLKKLRAAGIDVTHGVCRVEAEKLIEPFKTWICENRPFVSLKLAMTIDGKIADRDGNSKWITSGQSRKQVHMLRKRVDAIMVGRATAVADDPSLTCRPHKKPAPWRVITDSRGRLPLSARLLNDDLARYTVVATTSQCSSKRQAEYRRKGAEVWVIPGRGKRVSLLPLMKKMAEQEIIHVLCEGGGELALALIKQSLVDEYVFFIAPCMLGGRASALAPAGAGWHLANCPKLRFDDIRRVGDDVMIIARPVTQGA